MMAITQAVPAPVIGLVLLILAVGAAVSHWLYFARNRVHVREFIDGIKPFLRFPHDEVFLLTAIMCDAAIAVVLYLLATGRR